MAIRKTLFYYAVLFLLLFSFTLQSSELLSFSLETYIAEVLVNNQELKLGSFKVKLKEAQGITKKRETPISLGVSADNSASNRLSTSSLDPPNTIIETNSNALSTQISKTFFTGTNIGVSYGYSYSRNTSGSIQESLKKVHTSNINVSLSQPLLSDLFNLIKRREQNAADITSRISALDYQNTMVTTIIKAIESYFNLIQQNMQLSLKEQALKHATMSIKTEEELAEKGFSNKDKLLQYKTQILEKENDLYKVENSYQEQRSAFLELINMYEDEQNIVLLTLPMTPQTNIYNSQLDTLVEQATRVRPDYLSAKAQYEIANLNLTIQRNASLPDLNLTSNYYIYGEGVSFKESFERINPNDFNSWSVGLSLSTPLGNRAKRDKLLSYTISVSEAEYKKSSLKRKIRQELKSLINKLNLNYKQFNSTSSNVSVAELNLKEAQELLDKGFITLEEFLKSRKNQESSELQMITSKCDYTVNWYKMKKAGGSLLNLFGEKK